MSDFLTAKQVIDLLKVDRTTLYRMLREERVKGVKVGSQWRFPRKQIEELLNPDLVMKQEKPESSREVLPLHCIEPIQDVFSDMAQVAALTTDAEGVPLSEFSNSCKFCQMILSTEKGRAGCIESWKNLDLKRSQANQFVKCHAGLNYAGANINLEGKKVAMLIAGQYYVDQPDAETEQARIKNIAVDFGLDPEELCNAVKEIRTIDERMKKFVGEWLQKVAKSFERIGHERKELLNRLKNIAEISNL